MSTRVVAATVSSHRRTDRLTPDCDQIKRLVARGMTDQEIADWTLENMGNRVTRSAVLKARQRCGVESANPRGRHEAEVPWLVRDEDQHHPWVRNLRLLGRANKGLPLKKDERGMLRKFLAELDAADEGRGGSIWYDPDYLSIRFVVTPRDPSRGETYVRYPPDWDGPRI